MEVQIVQVMLPRVNKIIFIHENRTSYDCHNNEEYTPLEGNEHGFVMSVLANISAKFSRTKYFRRIPK